MIEFNLGKIWKTHSPRYHENIFPEAFYIIKFFAFNINWTKWSYQFIDTDCGFFIKFCEPFKYSKGIQPFDFIKSKVI